MSYDSHKKYLTEELEKLDYSKPVHVLEFGTGDGSASILHSFAKHNPNLRIDSYEDDFNWFRETSGRYLADNYHFHQVESWDKLFSETIFNESYDLVFVDSSPWDARIQAIEAVKETAKVIILHDYDWFNKGVIEDIYSTDKGSFYDTKYGKDFTFEGYFEVFPGTLIMRQKECKHPVGRVEIIDFNSGKYYCCKCKKMIIIKQPKE